MLVPLQKTPLLFIPGHLSKLWREMTLCSTDILIVGCCLANLDKDGCLLLTGREVSDMLGISFKAFYNAIEKLKTLGVEKVFSRYCFKKFIELTVKTDEVVNGLR